MELTSLIRNNNINPDHEMVLLYSYTIFCMRYSNLSEYVLLCILLQKKTVLSVQVVNFPSHDSRLLLCTLELHQGSN